MYILFTILIIITCVLLVLVVLVQNPKGGGLSSSFGGGAGNQIMGAKKTTDFLEKATWTLAIALIALSLLSNFAIERNNTGETVDMKAEGLVDEAPMPPANPTNGE